MNVLYIIGNGFDKAQGLDTCYSDFYSKYMMVEPESDLEAKVKSEISSNYETWADMEVAMGDYSREFDDVFVFRDVIKLLNRRLKEYLLDQNARLKELGLSRTRLIEDILNPASFLEPDHRVLLLEKIQYSSPVLVDWVTFNYTSTFESVLSSSGIIRSNPGMKSDRLGSLLHIHGSLSDKLVLGVNDASQIANESFRNDQYLLYEFVKPMYNRGCQNNRESQFISKIKEADIIVLMGTSVGITDSVWWKTIGNELQSSKSKMILYFPFDPNKDTIENECFKSLWSTEYISFLKKAMGITMDIEVLKKRIFVGINKAFLHLRSEK